MEIAQVQHNIGQLEGTGELGNVSEIGAREAAPLFVTVISSFIGLITVIIFILFFFTLVSGAIQLMSAGSDKGKFEEGKEKITKGVIGVSLAIVALLLVSILGDFLGTRSILNIESAIYLFESLVL